MVQKKPKKLHTRERKIILNGKLKELIEYGYSQTELSNELNEAQSTISGILSYNSLYSISLDKTDIIINKVDELLNSLN